ncbi:hypothetical protein C3L33_22004, partial [Rhododendron williamsianum]
MAGVGAFWGTRVLEIVKKHDSGGLVWKRIKLTTTRKANAKKRLLRVWQMLCDERPSVAMESSQACNEAVLKACAEQPPEKASLTSTAGVLEKAAAPGLD